MFSHLPLSGQVSNTCLFSCLHLGPLTAVVIYGTSFAMSARVYWLGASLRETTRRLLSLMCTHCAIWTTRVNRPEVGKLGTDGREGFCVAYLIKLFEGVLWHFQRCMGANEFQCLRLLVPTVP